MVSSNLVFPVEMTVTTILQQGMIGSEVPGKTPQPGPKSFTEAGGI